MLPKVGSSAVMNLRNFFKVIKLRLNSSEHPCDEYCYFIFFQLYYVVSVDGDALCQASNYKLQVSIT